MGSEELTRVLRNLFRKGRPPGFASSGPKLEVGPCCPFEALLEERQKELEREMGEVRSRVNGLLFLVVGAVLVQVLLRLAA